MAMGSNSLSGFRWLDFDFSIFRSSSCSILRWPAELLSSYFTPNSSRRTSSWWAPQRFPLQLRWPEMEFSIVDDVLWPVVTAFESVALVSMLCFYFVFCGCTL